MYLNCNSALAFSSNSADASLHCYPSSRSCRGFGIWAEEMLQKVGTINEIGHVIDDIDSRQASEEVLITSQDPLSLLKLQKPKRLSVTISIAYPLHNDNEAASDTITCN
uniref:Uncharacterized protein n=1 Tax=Physcomitrium patens TaxID=3218 RepID=A0A2K1IHZ9_PHYPA|nr:hypothetical protein PHYPA_027597 [Physcomitrium patens]